MNRRYLLLLMSMAFLSSKATLVSFFATEYEHFSLVLFTVDKNILRIEKYGLDELVPNDMNVISRKMSNSHCSHIIHLSERGQKFKEVARHPNKPAEFAMTTLRGKNKITYTLSWAKLILNDIDAVQDFMHAQVDLKQAEDLELDEYTKSPWNSFMSISWGPHAQSNFNLAFERMVEKAHAIVVPNVLCKSFEVPQTLKKQDMLNAGILTLIESCALTNQDIDEEIILNTSLTRQEKMESLNPSQIPAGHLKEAHGNWPKELMHTIKEKINAFVASLIKLVPKPHK